MVISEGGNTEMDGGVVEEMGDGDGGRNGKTEAEMGMVGEMVKAKMVMEKTGIMGEMVKRRWDGDGGKDGKTEMEGWDMVFSIGALGW